jgi:predicted Zn-dependent peptidase
VLANGVRIVTQTHPGLHSAAIGVWLHNGSRHQARHQSGYAHLLEHLLFTDKESADGYRLQHRFEAMGGAVNAQTGRELMAWYGLVPEGYVSECLGLLVERLVRPGFDAEDVARECRVALREMHDTPPDPTDLCLARIWGDHPMAWPILGHPDVLREATASKLHAYWRDRCQGACLVVSAYGAVDHGRIVATCEPLARLARGTPPHTTTPVFRPLTEQRPAGRVNGEIIWVLPGSSLVRADTYVATPALLHLLAGGPASRLQQSLRERQGLIYGLTSELQCFSNGVIGILGVAVEPDRVAMVTEQIEGELDDLARNGPTQAEVSRCRDYLHARIALERDDPQACMERLARETLLLGKPVDDSERRRRIGGLCVKAIANVAATLNARRARLLG